RCGLKKTKKKKIIIIIKKSGQYAHSGLFILVMIYPGFKREADAGVAKPTVLRSMTLDL
uniref:Uncharacterized protein n=1 Tax=Sus scrofa TaxID=9823 RepID=A0A8W4FEI8_PIG